MAEEVRKAGGEPVRDRVGHVFMKKTMSERNAVFGGELSRPLLLPRQLLRRQRRDRLRPRAVDPQQERQEAQSELAGPIDRYRQTGEVNFRVEDKEGAIRKVADKYKRFDVDYLDGITVDAEAAEGFWFNVRQSNTEPLLAAEPGGEGIRRRSTRSSTTSRPSSASRRRATESLSQGHATRLEVRLRTPQFPKLRTSELFVCGPVLVRTASRRPSTPAGSRRALTSVQP